MAKSKKNATKLGRKQLVAKIEKAMKYGNFDYAVEASRQLANDFPSAENSALYKNIWQQVHQTLMAAREYQKVCQLMETAPLDFATEKMIRDYALALIRTRYIDTAFEVREKVSDPSLLQSIDNALADHLIETQSLPAECPEAFKKEAKLILDAFGLLEKRNDQVLLAAIKEIGFRSPFAEWKLALRGLQAYYQNDDEKALANWQRLDSERLPAQVVAPYRFEIDAEFAKNHSGQIQMKLRDAYFALRNEPLISDIRSAYDFFVKEASVGDFIKALRGPVNALKHKYQDLFQRLRKVCYWMIVDQGYREDVVTFRRIFPSLEDDPQLHRLNAIALETRNVFHEAHEHWQKYLQTIDKLACFNDLEKSQAKAFCWQHMGIAAYNHRIEKVGFDPFDLKGNRKKRQILEPDVETCFKKSVELDPNNRDSWYWLRNHYVADRNAVGEIETLRQTLAHFPDDNESLESIGRLLQEQKNYEEGLLWLQKAQKANPLKSELNERLCFSHLDFAIPLAVEKNKELARHHISEAERFAQSRIQKYGLIIAKAMMEYAFGNKKEGDELIETIYASDFTEIARAYLMLVEATRFKVAKLKKSWNATLNVLLNSNPGPDQIIDVLSAINYYNGNLQRYFGQQTHEKKLFAFVGSGKNLRYTDPEMKTICLLLKVFEQKKLFFEFCEIAKAKHRDLFEVEVLEITYQAELKQKNFNPFVARMRLDLIQSEVKKLPAGPRKSQLLNDIVETEELLGKMERPIPAFFQTGPFSEFFNEMDSFFD